MTERGFPSSAELREMTAVAAAEAMRPVAPLAIAGAVALLLASAWLFWTLAPLARACVLSVQA
ncbi:MAG: hypothetical protein AB7O88_28500 [Reyranellaceae bacterium]